MTPTEKMREEAAQVCEEIAHDHARQAKMASRTDAHPTQWEHQRTSNNFLVAASVIRTLPVEQYETCPTCGGSGMTLGGAGEPGLCPKCKGDTVVLAEPDEDVVERVARAIHDTEDMADTVWPDAEEDTGYRGDGGHVRLCLDPDLFRKAARAAIKAMGVD